jgi:hypothetical protein
LLLPAGHNFAAQHTFQNGQGSTGSIMDYGDGKLNGEYQFHTTYSKVTSHFALTCLLFSMVCADLVVIAAVALAFSRLRCARRSPPQ